MVTPGSVIVTPGSVIVTPGSVIVTTGSVIVTPGSVVVSDKDLFARNKKARFYEREVNEMTFEEWLGLSYRNPSRVDRITLAKLFYQCVDMEPLDKSFDLTPFINTKQRVREVVKEYFCHNNGVQEALVLDDDDLAMMENYLDLNPHNGFVDTEEEEFEKRL
ncbi:hypothetical protein Tco_0849922 [Tanacetum coccineum]